MRYYHGQPLQCLEALVLKIKQLVVAMRPTTLGTCTTCMLQVPTPMTNLGLMVQDWAPQEQHSIAVQATGDAV